MKNVQKIISRNHLEMLRAYYYLTSLCIRSEKEVEEVAIKYEMERNDLERLKIESHGIITPTIKSISDAINIAEGFLAVVRHGSQQLKDLRRFNAGHILFKFGMEPDGNSGEHQIVLELVEKYLDCPPLNKVFEQDHIKIKDDVIIKIG